VDVLVNNAGVGMQKINPRFASNPTRFWELTPAQWRELIEINATSQFLMARSCVPHLMQKGWGRIINVTTSFFTMQFAGFCPYGPSKAAAEVSTVSMSRDLDKTGVTANVLIPGGPANTGMVTDEVRRGARGESFLVLHFSSPPHLERCRAGPAGAGAAAAGISFYAFGWWRTRCGRGSRSARGKRWACDIDLQGARAARQRICLSAVRSSTTA
jgi:NAD(P)-dependent dehydrogenase (short-subunit alcohol dehydrogenase family)